MQDPSAQSLAGQALESEALIWDMGTWLLICSCICTWVGLGASAPGEGGGEGTREVGGWRVGQGRAVLCQTPQGRVCPKLCWDLSSRNQSGLQSHPCMMNQSLLPPRPPDFPLDEFLRDPSLGTACQGVSCQSLAVTHSRPGAATVSLSSGPGAGTVTCLNNNILRIDCHWSAPEPSQGASSWLLFTR